MNVPTSAILLFMLCSITAALPIAKSPSPDPTLTAEFFVHLYKGIRQNASTISYQIGQFDIPPSPEQLVQLAAMGIECQQLIDFFTRTKQTRKLTSLSVGGRIRCWFSEMWCWGQLSQTQQAINDALRGFQNVPNSSQISGTSQAIVVSKSPSPSAIMVGSSTSSSPSPPPSSPKLSTSRNFVQPLVGPPPSSPAPNSGVLNTNTTSPPFVDSSAAFTDFKSQYHTCSIKIQGVNTVLQQQDLSLLPNLIVLLTQAAALAKIDVQITSITNSCKRSSALSPSQSVQLDVMASYLHSQVNSQSAQIAILKQKAGIVGH